MGPKALLCVEQKVILEEDPAKARAIARQTAKTYQSLPNYRNNWLRMGLTQEDIDGEGSDSFIDSTFAWGTIDAIRSRIQDHYDSGASHVCIQPVNPTGNFSEIHWDVLEKLAL